MWGKFMKKLFLIIVTLFAFTQFRVRGSKY